METMLNDYHKKINAIKLQSVASESNLNTYRCQSPRYTQH